MLVRLYVRNYAIVRALEVAPQSGLTIITGETGAGKSILVDALALTLGERADSNAVGPDGDKCVIEAEFRTGRVEVKSLLSSLEIDLQPTVILRRELMRDGRSRAFINDTPIKLNDLRAVGSLLVDIHSQHSALSLRDPAFLLHFVDVAAVPAATMHAYTDAYSAWMKCSNQLQTLETEQAQALAERDYLQFQFNELSDLSLKVDEFAALEQELLQAEHAGEIAQTTTELLGLLNDPDQSAIQFLGRAQTIAGQGLRHLQGSDAIRDRIRSVQIELKDIVAELEQSTRAIEVDPRRTEKLRERVDAIQRLLAKHRLNTDQQLIDLKDVLELKLNAIDKGGSDLTELRDASVKWKKTVDGLADKLSAARKAQLMPLSTTITEGLMYLGMPSAQVQLLLDTLPQTGPSGQDRVRMLFSANKGMEAQEAGKVASGGELSRLMLVMKSHLAQQADMPTVVLDEIDTGVSGETAGRIGERIAQLSKHMQVFSITHLPQVAARADHHLHVYKVEDDKGTGSSVRTLSATERVDELARMLSAGPLTDAARANAKQLMAAH